MMIFRKEHQGNSIIPKRRKASWLAMGIIVALFSNLLYPLTSYATLPVIDYTAIAQLLKEFNQLKQQYDMMKHQYNQMKSQYNSITGIRGMGSWQNDANILQHQREWAASDWKSALKGEAGGNPDRYKQLLDQYQQAHATMSGDDYAKGTDKALSTSYQNEVHTNQASATTATYEFNDINQHLNTLYQLGQKIEDAKSNKDLKAAMDLNSRVQLEVGYISIEELRMQAVLNQQMAQVQAAKIAMENEASQYNQAGENP